MNRRAYRSQHAFSLLELVLSMALLSIVMLAMGGLVALASRTLPPPDALDNSRNELLEHVIRFQDEVLHAVEFTELSANAVEFTIADRTGDSTPDSVRYEWNGTAGATPRRIFGPSSVTTHFPAADAFAFAWSLERTSAGVAPTDNSFETARAVDSAATSVTLTTLSANHMQIVTPTGVDRWWMPESVTVQLVRGLGIGVLRIAVYAADPVTLRPIGEPLTRVSVPYSVTSSPARWNERIDIPTGLILPSTTGIAVVFDSSLVVGSIGFGVGVANSGVPGLRRHNGSAWESASSAAAFAAVTAIELDESNALPDRLVDLTLRYRPTGSTQDLAVLAAPAAPSEYNP